MSVHTMPASSCSDWHREKNKQMTETDNQRGSAKAKPAHTPEGNFPSASAAARHYGVSKRTMIDRLNDKIWNKRGFYYIENEGK